MAADDDEVKGMACGIKIPKGKIRGTPEYCVQINQVRHYGVVAIDEKTLETAKGKSGDLVKEQLKMKKIESDAKVLLKEFKKLKIIAEEPGATKKEKTSAEKKIGELLVKKNALVKRLNAQKKVVDALLDEEAEKKARQTKTAKSTKKSTKSTKKSTKSTKKSTDKAGSKTSKKKKRNYMY